MIGRRLFVLAHVCGMATVVVVVAGEQDRWALMIAAAAVALWAGIAHAIQFDRFATRVEQLIDAAQRVAHPDEPDDDDL